MLLRMHDCVDRVCVPILTACGERRVLHPNPSPSSPCERCRRLGARLGERRCGCDRHARRQEAADTRPGTIEHSVRCATPSEHPYAKREFTYDGVLFSDLLDHLGSKAMPADDSTVGWDDYASSSRCGRTAVAVMLATRMDGSGWLFATGARHGSSSHTTLHHRSDSHTISGSGASSRSRPDDADAAGTAWVARDGTSVFRRSVAVVAPARVCCSSHTGKIDDAAKVVQGGGVRTDERRKRAARGAAPPDRAFPSAGLRTSFCRSSTCVWECSPVTFSVARSHDQAQLAPNFQLMTQLMLELESGRRRDQGEQPDHLLRPDGRSNSDQFRARSRRPVRHGRAELLRPHSRRLNDSAIPG